MLSFYFFSILSAIYCTNTPQELKRTNKKNRDRNPIQKQSKYNYNKKEGGEEILIC